MFGRFDFSILSDPEFKEDSVREELVVPILSRLGYSATGEHRIIRSKTLVHPFVYIGTTRYKVNIIPDYLLTVAGSPKWVLDAKAPAEEIVTGSHVEQAYSYAIHKDVRVELYSLCNGHSLVVFHISHVEPILNVPLMQVDDRWGEINKVLCPMAFLDPERIEFLPDYGLTMLRLGGGKIKSLYLPWVPVEYLGRVADDHYTLSCCMNMGIDVCATFDLDPAMYQALLNSLSEADRAKTMLALTRQPYYIIFEHDQPPLALDTKLGESVEFNGRENYIPYKVIAVQKSVMTAESMLKALPYETE